MGQVHAWPFQFLRTNDLKMSYIRRIIFSFYLERFVKCALKWIDASSGLALESSIFVHFFSSLVDLERIVRTRYGSF